MNLIFWRNVLSIMFLVVFVLDLVFGNGVGNWYDWIFGAVLVNAGGNLLSTFEKYHGTREIYRFNSDAFTDVLDAIVIVLFAIRVIFGTALDWQEFLIGAAFAYSVRNLIKTFTERR